MTVYCEPNLKKENKKRERAVHNTTRKQLTLHIAGDGAPIEHRA
jgi:hypothetical protein